jgi:transcription-repair coupling factor (superfamily II helicase)
MILCISEYSFAAQNLKIYGKDGTPPKIYKLGSNAWKVLKQKTKARVKAFNLIQLYED